MNPLFTGNESPNGATQPTKAVNRQGVGVKRTHNTFDTSYFNYKTQIFGKYEPFFVMEGVSGDRIPLYSSHTVRSLPFKAPLLSSLKLNKDYFMVPMQSILPNTWELIFKNPSQGDDVPDDCNCVMYLGSLMNSSGLIDTLLKSLCFKNLYSESAPIPAPSTSGQYAAYFLHLFMAEMFFSSSCLLRQVGYSIIPRFFGGDGREHSFDFIFDALVRCIKNISFVYQDGNISKNISSSRLPLASCISIFRDNVSRIDFTTVNISVNTGDFGNILSSYSYSLMSFSVDNGGSNDFELLGLNISRLLAYQLINFQFYVNPNVDFIYNSQLYRDNFFSLVRAYLNDNYNLDVSIDSFTINGISVPYDFFSSHYLNQCVSVFCENFSDYSPYADDITTDFSPALAFYNLLFYIFGLRDCLKFGDYFTDCRTRPYAVGNMETPVVGNKVSAIDITKSLVMQRFLNNVQKLGNNFGDYLRGIFGESPTPDYHFPKFISHQEFDIDTNEVTNVTSDDQGAIVTNLRSSADKYAFEVEVSMPCILMGISYFSVPRLYSSVKDRFFFHYDRFDMFNPMLQYVGDQPVYNIERTDYYRPDSNFGYQSRYGEYKQRVSVASGGFIDKLTGWAFVADNDFDGVQKSDFYPYQSPDFIRACDYEFDRFVGVLSGYSLGHRFHFVVVYDNKVVCNRPLEINPNIL